MLRILRVLSLFVVSLVFGAESGPGWYRHEFEGPLDIELGLGTPVQKIRFNWSPLAVWVLNPLIAAVDAEYGGDFNATASTTFHKTQETANGFGGFDTVQLGAAQRFPNIGVMVKRERNELPYVSLAHGRGRMLNFVDQILPALGGDRAIVVEIRESRVGHHSGAIVLGQTQPKNCADKWAIFAAKEENFAQFSLEADSVEIGKFEQSGNLIVGFIPQGVMLKSDLHAIARKQLRVDGNDRLDCSQKTPIRIRAGELLWTIGPELYRRRDGDFCEFAVSRGFTRLPLSLLNGHCLRYDYERNTVGIARLVGV